MGCEVILPVLRRLKASLGVSRILFGSDGIFNLERLLQAVKGADFLSDSDKEKILGKNAEGIFK
jgi:predicted TIM-barrel fold metal-dependent hydrolase